MSGYLVKVSPFIQKLYVLNIYCIYLFKFKFLFIQFLNKHKYIHILVSIVHMGSFITRKNSDVETVDFRVVCQESPTGQHIPVNYRGMVENHRVSSED